MNQRLKAGMGAGMIGIIINAVLFIFKILVGYSVKSNAIIADAFNNLSDSINAIITLVGFIIAAKPADKEHPYGHGRMEVIGGFVMSLVIGYIGIDVLKSSVSSLWNQEHVVYSNITYLVMIVSMGLKALLYVYYKQANKKAHSDVLVAGAQDSLNDVLISLGIFIGIFIQAQFGFDYIDGLIGIIISLIILYSSLKLIKGFIDELMGVRPKAELIEAIVETIDVDLILGFHDLMIHDYGNEHTYASVHIELPAELSLIKAHDIIDQLERDVKRNHNIDLLVHIDPVDSNDTIVLKYKPIIQDILNQIDTSLKYHDMRYIHEHLMFDIVVSETLKLNDIELKEMIKNELKNRNLDIETQIQIDRNVLIP